MKIAVLSGKGGTGKTFVSVNLACAAESAAKSNLNSVYVDCDVEEPNGNLFLKPTNIKKSGVNVTVPVVDNTKCTGCRKCSDFCKYNALAYVKDRLLIFNEVCHSCGGCIIFCPQKALKERQREIGVIEEGISGKTTVFAGNLNTGEVSGVPIIKELLQKLPDNGSVIIDCPPGSACTVMESIRQVDYCLLVAEPTLFGVHNLSMVYELVKLLKKPFGVVLNKCLADEENPSEQFCKENRITIIEKIPYDKEIGRLNSKGLAAVRENGTYKKLFERILDKLVKESLQ